MRLQKRDPEEYIDDSRRNVHPRESRTDGNVGLEEPRGAGSTPTSVLGEKLTDHHGKVGVGRAKRTGGRTTSLPSWNREPVARMLTRTRTSASRVHPEKPKGAHQMLSAALTPASRSQAHTDLE